MVSRGNTKTPANSPPRKHSLFQTLTWNGWELQGTGNRCSAEGQCYTTLLETHVSSGNKLTHTRQTIMAGQDTRGSPFLSPRVNSEATDRIGDLPTVTVARAWLLRHLLAGSGVTQSNRPAKGCESIRPGRVLGMLYLKFQSSDVTRHNYCDLVDSTKN